MKLFTCTNCDAIVHFDNTICTSCSSPLGFIPDSFSMTALAADGPALSDGRQWRRCANHGPALADCNWLVAEEEGQAFCIACRLNRTIPDLSVTGHAQLWQRLEEEKRRLIYSALRLRLPVGPKEGGRPGLAFDFLADPDPRFSDAGRVLTGHADGLITLNIAEADPVIRETSRAEMDEPYRTILGHFRHESGHYYWDRLVRDTPLIAPFRALFGDDRADYGAALQRHYDNGPPVDWHDHHISAYASTHPWEDWAESWSHYLHMVDTLETAWAYGLRVDARQDSSDTLMVEPDADPYRILDFGILIRQWMPLTVALNSLNRSMGHEHAYPFTLPDPVIAKLGFVHAVVHDLAPAPPG